MAQTVLRCFFKLELVIVIGLFRDSCGGISKRKEILTFTSLIDFYLETQIRRFVLNLSYKVTRPGKF